MRILIVDDERPARNELRHILDELLPNSRFAEADSGEGALEQMNDQEFDVLFIDINLGDMEGTAVATAARKMQPGVPVIFATAYSDYAVKAFDVGAVDYILKPFNPERIEKTVRRLLESQPAKSAPVDGASPDKLSVNCGKKTVLLDIGDVAYIETNNRGCIIHTTEGDYADSTPIGVFEQRLAGQRFFRSHKSYLINLKYVNAIFPWHGGGSALTLRGFEKDILPVGRSQLRQLRSLFSF